MTELELMKKAKPILHMEEFKAFLDLIRLKQAAQLKRAMSIVEPYEIYRSQGRVHAYDGLLSMTEEIKAL